MTSGPCQETSYTAITLSPEWNFTRREKNHFQFHWSTLTSPELHERIWMSCLSAASMTIENINGSMDVSDYWTGFTQFMLLEEKPQDGFMWSGRRLTKWQATSRPDHLWPELWRGLARNAKLRETQKWSSEKPKLDDARRLRGIYIIDPEVKEFKETIKMLARNWKHLWLLPCRAKLWRAMRIVGVVHPIKSKQNLRVFWKLVNLQDCVLENHYRLITRTILQEEGQVTATLQYGTQIYSYASSNEDTSS